MKRSKSGNLAILGLIVHAMPSSFRVFATSLRAVNVFPFALGLPLINKTFFIS